MNGLPSPGRGRTTRREGAARRPDAPRRLLLAALLLSFAALAPAAPGSAGPSEADVKAAFVLNFIKFVEWPSSTFGSPEDPLLLAVLGRDPVADAIRHLDGKAVSGRRLIVRRMLEFSALDDCHVLFVAASEKEELPALLRAVQRRPVLTVADFDGFAARGGTIGFIRQNDRVAFEINEESVRNAGLKVNAKLLYLGKSVQAGGGGKP